MNRIWPIPAPGFSLITGKRRPPSSWGTELFCQIRAGFVSETPWPVSTTRWVHDGTAGDVVAVKATDENVKARSEGRQANGAYE